jgi:hypothetical protein
MDEFGEPLRLVVGKSASGVGFPNRSRQLDKCDGGSVRDGRFDLIREQGRAPSWGRIGANDLKAGS